MKRYLQDYIFLLVLAGSIIALDQWTKDWVRSTLMISETWVPWDWLAPYARIVNWKNTGAAFGLGQDFGKVITVFAILVSGAIIYYFHQVPRSDWPLRVAMGMQLGGAVGNLIDRLTQGYVTDFVSVGNFPVFNVADASISTGVAVLILGMWIKDRTQGTPEIPPDEKAQEIEAPLVREEIQGE
ncbi:MAG: signal peptidase II [Anaerolineales bacterium]